MIDKSIAARHHAQFLANQMADEARLNNHHHGCMECSKGGTLSANALDLSLLWQKLIRNHKLVTVEYSAAVEEEHEHPLPVGLERRDIYLID